MSILPNRVYIEIIIAHPLNYKNGGAFLLDQLNNFGFPPRTWGLEDGEKRPFDREEALAELDRLIDSSCPFTLDKPGKGGYDLFTILNPQLLNGISWEFRTPRSMEQLQSMFKLFDAICLEFDPEYAFIHPVWDQAGDDVQNYSASGSLRDKDYARCGPCPLTARTWIGSRVVNLVGIDLLQKSSIHFEASGSLGSQLVSLLPEPWERSLAELMQAQQRVMSVLNPSGVFGDYTGKFGIGKSGPRWQPIDLEWKDTGAIKILYDA